MKHYKGNDLHPENLIEGEDYIIVTEEGSVLSVSTGVFCFMYIEDNRLMLQFRQRTKYLSTGVKQTEYLKLPFKLIKEIKV